jgi:hypothetical protein
MKSNNLRRCSTLLSLLFLVTFKSFAADITPSQRVKEFVNAFAGTDREQADPNSAGRESDPLFSLRNQISIGYDTRTGIPSKNARRAI